MSATKLKYKPDYIAKVVDELGAAVATRKDAEKREKELKKTLEHVMEAEGGTTYFVGSQYEAHLSLASRSFLPKDAVKLALGEKWVADHEKETPYLKVNVQPRTS